MSEASEKGTKACWLEEDSSENIDNTVEGCAQTLANMKESSANRVEEMKEECNSTGESKKCENRKVDPKLRRGHGIHTGMKNKKRVHFRNQRHVYSVQGYAVSSQKQICKNLVFVIELKECKG